MTDPPSSTQLAINSADPPDLTTSPARTRVVPRSGKSEIDNRVSADTPYSSHSRSAARKGLRLASPR